jgi:hypothetical protein
MYNIFHLKMNKGYTLLFAVLTASLVLGVAAFIVGIARKQYILSSSARDSTYAFYSADSGLECLEKTALDGSLATTSSINIACAGNGVIASFGSPTVKTMGAYSYNEYTASTTLGFSNDSTPSVINSPSDTLWGCVNVVIRNRENINIPAYTPGTIFMTIVDSRGYNLCTYNAGSSEFEPDASPRTVERALRWIQSF